PVLVHPRHGPRLARPALPGLAIDPASMLAELARSVMPPRPLLPISGRSQYSHDDPAIRQMKYDICNTTFVQDIPRPPVCQSDIRQKQGVTVVSGPRLQSRDRGIVRRGEAGIYRRFFCEKPPLPDGRRG